MTYHSVVTAPGQIVLGIAGALVVGLVLLSLRGTLWPLAAVALVTVALAAYYLSSVSLDVTERRVVIGQGRWERRPLTIPATEIVDLVAVELGWAQCLGVGLPREQRVQPGSATRLSVRAGPTLCLGLRDGETVRISTPDPDAAIRVLRRSTPRSDGTGPPAR